MRHALLVPTLAALAMLLASCGGGADEVAVEQPQKRERRETAFDGQLRALDKARDVERRLMEADEARRRALDEQSR